MLVVGFGTVAILGVMFRLARVHAAFSEVKDAESHAELRRLSRDLLAIAALIVTLATLGSGVIQISLNAMAEAVTDYTSFLTGSHVIAYGGYFSVLLILFFTPVLVAERRAAYRLVRTQPVGSRAPVATKLGLESSMTEHLASAFGVLSPLLGALVTRLLS